MDKELFLLGIIRSTHTHGYQINELIDLHFNTLINLTRPTAYRILNKMVNDGWVDYQEISEGNRPLKKVFSITEKGESEFQNLLRKSIQTYKPSHASSGVDLALMDCLPKNELIDLLESRKKHVHQLIIKIKESEKHQKNFERMFEYQLRHLQTEIVWIDELLLSFRVDS